jgi:hypothetical protein
MTAASARTLAITQEHCDAVNRGGNEVRMVIGVDIGNDQPINLAIDVVRGPGQRFERAVPRFWRTFT